MHAHSIDQWRHEHVFLGAHHDRNERRSWAVVALCVTMMTAEIVGGMLWGSMALVADGLHMSTHAAALVIAALAYAYARSHARDDRFAFGTGKLGDLAAFASGIVLAMIALLIGYESLARLFRPVPIAFSEAIPLAAARAGRQPHQRLAVARGSRPRDRARARASRPPPPTRRSQSPRRLPSRCRGRRSITDGAAWIIRGPDPWLGLDGPGNGHHRRAGYCQLVMEPCAQHQLGLARYAGRKGSGSRDHGPDRGS